MSDDNQSFGSSNKISLTKKGAVNFDKLEKEFEERQNAEKAKAEAKAKMSSMMINLKAKVHTDPMHFENTDLDVNNAI